tara:strand:- start:600 stop:977 length:378 start_codon:yes stop_codon:yes gene_type:complete
MAHYALLDENNIVVKIITGKDEGEDNKTSEQWEEHYGSFFNKTCKRTSYNSYGNVHSGGGTPFRKNYAGLGYSYDATKDAFIAPQPYPSYILNETTCLWEPPIARPEPYQPNQYWDEDSQSWVTD